MSSTRRTAAGVHKQERPTRRLFFALWPDDRLRDDLIRRRALLGDVSSRRVPDHNLHLTLVFLGNQCASRFGDIIAIADECSSLRGELTLDHFGWFPRAQVAWLGGEAPEPLNHWVVSLSQRLTAAGLSIQPRDFRPHVTLFRAVQQAPAWPDCPPLYWPLSAFSLIESLPSRPYQVLRTWSV